MTGDINFFRKRFFGGFNREDVASYIAKMARERNELAAAVEKAESEARVLAREILALRLETEEAMRVMKKELEQKTSVFETAGNTFTEFEATFKGLRLTIEAAATSVYAELKNAGDSVAKLPSVIAQAGERFEELRAAFDEETSSSEKIGTDMPQMADANAAYEAGMDSAWEAGIEAGFKTVAESAYEAGTDMAWEARADVAREAWTEVTYEPGADLPYDEDAGDMYETGGFTAPSVTK